MWKKCTWNSDFKSHLKHKRKLETEKLGNI